jgi:hypothetical protein
VTFSPAEADAGALAGAAEAGALAGADAGALGTADGSPLGTADGSPDGAPLAATSVGGGAYVQPAASSELAQAATRNVTAAMAAAMDA